MFGDLDVWDSVGLKKRGRIIVLYNDILVIAKTSRSTKVLKWKLSLDSVQLKDGKELELHHQLNSSKDEIFDGASFSLIQKVSENTFFFFRLDEI